MSELGKFLPRLWGQRTMLPYIRNYFLSDTVDRWLTVILPLYFGPICKIVLDDESSASIPQRLACMMQFECSTFHLFAEQKREETPQLSRHLKLSSGMLDYSRAHLDRYKIPTWCVRVGDNQQYANTFQGSEWIKYPFSTMG
jgi:hypothetical protein